VCVSQRVDKVSVNEHLLTHMLNESLINEQKKQIRQSMEAMNIQQQEQNIVDNVSDAYVLSTSSSIDTLTAARPPHPQQPMVPVVFPPVTSSSALAPMPTQPQWHGLGQEIFNQ